MDVNGNDIGERLARLERENRRLKGWGASAFALLFAFGLVTGGLLRTPRELKAERFVVQDQTGCVRARIGLTADGSTELSLFDTQGRYQLAARGGQDRLVSLDLFDEGDERVSLSAAAPGNASLCFIGPDRRAASGLYLEPSGSMGLGFRHAAQGMTLGIDRQGAARLMLSDKDGRESGGLVSTSAGTLRATRVETDRPALSKAEPISKGGE